jgi:soluble lytic murein transglycosylase
VTGVATRTALMSLAFVCFAAVCAQLPVHASTTLAAERVRFLAAEQAFRAGKSERYEALAATLVDYPLYPYLRYEQLRARLGRANDEAIETFLAETGHGPLPSRLRTQWLRRLAADHRWQKFIDVYTPGRGTTLKCHYLHALFETGRSSQALEQIEPLWLHARSQPNECDSSFAAWRDAGRLTPDLVWSRVALAINAGEIGLAAYLKRFLPAPDRASVDLWVSLRKQPQRVTESTLFDDTGTRGRDIQLWAMHRLARVDVEAAEAAWSVLQETMTLSGEESSAVQRRIALSHATRHDARALSWFQTLPESAADETVREWRILSALRHQRWPLVLEYIEQLPAQERSDERWRYWWARAAEATGRGDAAAAEYRSIASQRNYYAFLASDTLSLPYQFNHRVLTFDSADVESLSTFPGVQRARELFALDRWVDARREWRVVLETHPTPEQHGVLAVIADAWGWHGRAIITVASTPYLNDLALRFPMPFATHFQAQADANQVDAAWVFAVARQESAFMPDARSPAGALGLMQIMPATGKHIAAKIGDNTFKTRKLLEPDLNVRFGSWYLRHLLGRSGGDPILATAGYNAGPHRVDRWLPKGGELAADIWIETIPFRETRKYVRRVLAYTAIYEFNLGRPGKRLSERFSVVKSAGT